MSNIRSGIGSVWDRWLRRALVCLALMLFSNFGIGPAHAAASDSFDHLRTGFPLAGAHKEQRCESCHIGGIFKGTPRDCESCHTSGARYARSNTVKPADHIPTQQSCSTCHSTRSFVGAKMDHSGIAKGSCQTCHNGAQVSGKPADHLPTTASCDSCHRTSAWRPASGFSHAGVAAGSCSSCHNGQKAMGKPAGHVPFQNVTSLASATCDSCHKAGFASWTPVRLHASVAVSAQCGSCHAALKPANALHAGQTVCESCHKSTSAWAGAKVDHAQFNVTTNCASCHNGSAATGKSAAHIPTGASNCTSCHSTSAWKPSAWNHSQLPVSNQCATCHSGAFPPADGKPANHVPYTSVAGLASANCDSCHKAGYAAWAPARVHANVAISSQCAACHAGIKPGTAIHAGQTVCENCHKSTASWSGAKVDHSQFTVATNCTSCHNGTGATGKPAVHIPVAATNCIACHSTASWKPTRWNHTQLTVTNQCASCHSGAFPPADGKPANHVPYQLVATLAAANCDSCHKAGFAAWAPARLHASVTVVNQCSSCHLSVRPNTQVHAGQTVCENCHRSTSTWSGAKVDHSQFTVATNCASCHNGTGATGKPAAHIPVQNTNCIACHSTTSWIPSKWNHTQIPTLDCASCHNGSYPPADGKPAQHIPYQTLTGVAISNCNTCHKGGYASWANGKFHLNVAVNGQCKTCHNGGYTSQGATAKPTNHIPETQLLNGAAMECNACHTSTTSWAQRMNHNGSQGSGAGWCKSCHATGTNYLGSMERMSLTHRTRTPVPTDCSESGCHRPLGNKGAAYTKWN